MKKVYSLSLPAIALVVLSLCGACSTLRSSDAAEPGIIAATDDYALLRWDNLALFNNHWGQGYLKVGSVHTGKVYYDTDPPVIGWEWSWPDERRDMLKAYPSLIIGDKPCTPAGYDESTDPRFPLPLDSIGELWVGGDIQVSGTGEFDFAYDLALLDGPRSSVPAVKTEIMIWLYAQYACGAEKRGEYSIDGVIYDLRVNTDWNPAVPYLAFIRTGGPIPKRVPLHDFFAIARGLGFCGPGMYLAAIELGPEIWRGTGSATLKNLKVDLVRK